MIKKFDNFKLNEEDEGGGCAISTGGNGMGAMISAQPSSIPGDVHGSTIGSGDIGSTLGTHSKMPITTVVSRKRKKKNKLHNIIEFAQFECGTNYRRYGNSVEDICTTKCLDCGMEIEDDIEQKKAHVYAKHWVHPTRNDEEANELIDKLFLK